MFVKKLVPILGLAVLAACTTPPTTSEAVRVPHYVYVPETYVSLSCVTHETGYIHSFYIEEPGVNNQPGWDQKYGGTNCGGTIAAGYPLPKKWYPGMTVKVRWNRPIKGEDSWHEKTTNIMRYTEVGQVFVHFFPGDQVRVVAANSGPTSSIHPIPRDAVVPPPEDQ